MEQVIILILVAGVFVGLVLLGFWTISKMGARAQQIVPWIFGSMVLVIIIFALVYLVRNQWPGIPRAI